MVLFDRDDGPGRRATVVAEVGSTFKSCSQEPFWQKCWKSIGFPKKSARARGVEFWQFFFEKPLVFLSFYVKIVTKPKVLEGFRLARANVHFTLFFARDSWSLDMWEHEMSFYSVFCKGRRGTTKQPDLVPIVLTEASSQKWWKWGCGLGAAGGARTRGANNNYSLEVIIFNNNNNHRAPGGALATHGP